MKAMQLKYIAVAGLLVLSLANQSFAVDVAEASGVMADLESLAVQAQKIITDGALAKDPDAIVEANKRSAAIDAAVADGRVSLAAMEQAVANGNTDLAESAEDDLAAALRQARDAFSGVLLETATVSANEESEDDSDDGSLQPNINDVPWKSQGIRAYYDSLFRSFDDASAYGRTKGLGDRDFGDIDDLGDIDATPQ
jgi:hypothetical protein